MAVSFCNQLTTTLHLSFHPSRNKINNKWSPNLEPCGAPYVKSLKWSLSLLHYELPDVINHLINIKINYVYVGIMFVGLHLYRSSAGMLQPSLLSNHGHIGQFSRHAECHFSVPMEEILWCLYGEAKSMVKLVSDFPAWVHVQSTTNN